MPNAVLKFPSACSLQQLPSKKGDAHLLKRRAALLSRCAGGFTLIEMLVVLAILAAVTSLAIRSAGNLQSQARYQQTTRQIDEIRNAIVGPSNERGADGSAVITGFVADTGRLPNFLISGSDPLGTGGDPFNELLEINGLPAFGFVQSNTDPYVVIGVGWKGPYLRLSAGPSYIRDGWGQSFHAYAANGTLLSTPVNAIYQIASWGADRTADSNHGGSGDTVGYNSDVSVPFANNLTSGGFQPNAALHGAVSMNIGTDGAGSTGPNPNLTYTRPATGSLLARTFSVTVWVSYFGPDLGATGRPVAEVPYDMTGTPNWQYTLPDPNSKITIGPRVLKAYVVDTASVSDANSFNNAISNPANFNSSTGPVFFSTTLNIAVAPGAQTVPTLILPHYSP